MDSCKVGSMEGGVIMLKPPGCGRWGRCTSSHWPGLNSNVGEWRVMRRRIEVGLEAAAMLAGWRSCGGSLVMRINETEIS